MDLLIKARSRLQADKTTGGDFVPNALLQMLRYEDLALLAQAFENHLNGLDSLQLRQPEAWHTLILHCLPKVQACSLLEDWRPLAMVCALHNLFESCLVLLAGTAQFACQICGFRPGVQPLDCIEQARLLLQKACEWGTPLFLGTIDVHKAFDSVSPRRLAQILQARLGTVLAFGLMRGLLHRRLRVQVAGYTSGLVDMLWGAKQGGRATPLEWNLFADHTLQPAFQAPLPAGAGVILDYDDHVQTVTHSIWADNIQFFATSVQGFKFLAGAILEALAAEGLQSKPVESQLLIAEAGTCPGLSQIRAEGCCTVQWSGGTHTFPVVQQIIILGVQLDGKGSTECSVLHALAQGTRAWHAQRSMLVRRSVPLAQRLGRL